MLKVKEQELLRDYNELAAKKSRGQAVTEADATAFAQAHGYDEEKTKRFVAYVLSEDVNGGLTDKEAATLDILGKYLEEIEDVAPDNDEPIVGETQEIATEEVAETPVGTPSEECETVKIV